MTCSEGSQSWWREEEETRKEKNVQTHNKKRCISYEAISIEQRTEVVIIIIRHAGPQREPLKRTR